jgi:hypothetical protein
MSQTGALIWFIATTLAVLGVLTIGTYFASHTYKRGRGVIHLWHRHG